MFSLFGTQSIFSNVNTILSCPNDMIVDLPPGECGQEVNFDNLNFSVNCPIVDTLFSPGSDSYFEIGTNPVLLTVIDTAGNQDSCVFNVVVNNFPSPINWLVCNSFIQVSLDTDCQAVISAEYILEGGPYSCYDDYPVNILDALGNSYGNVVDETFIGTIWTVVVSNQNGSSCWGQLEVDDKLPPIVNCPVDTTMYCNTLTDPLDENSMAFTDCGEITQVTVDQTINYFGDCLDPVGEVIREYTVSDNFGNSTNCTHTITLMPITLDDIVVPPNFDGISLPEISCEDYANDPSLIEPQNSGWLTVDGISIDAGLFCSTGFTYEDIIIDVCENSFKILRTWNYYDFCAPVVPGQNPRSANQVIEVIDNKSPEFTNCQDTIVISTDPSSCYASTQLLEVDVTDNCNDYSISITTDCPLVDPTNGIYQCEVGSHEVEYIATDPCGNTSTCSTTIIVEDQVPPVIVCEAGIVVELDQNYLFTLVPDLIDDGSYDNCSSDLTFSFSEDGSVSSIEFDCDEVGPHPISLWGTDENGNQNFCNTFVVVQDSINPCFSLPVVGGLIYTEDFDLVPGVTVTATDGNGNDVQYVTDLDGLYFFDLQPFQDYTIVPFKDDDILNGITTFDRVLIARHILGIQKLDSPYKIIAADVNNSGSVTIMDMIVLQQTILNMSTTFPNNTSWRFIDADYVFPDPTNPFLEPFPEIWEIQNLLFDMVDGDFIGVKIGDVN